MGRVALVAEISAVIHFGGEGEYPETSAADNTAFGLGGAGPPGGKDLTK